MARFPIRGLVVVSLGITVACVSAGPVGVTKSANLVEGCAKIGDVSVSAKTLESEVVADLAAEARRKGANYVLVSSDGARSGTAYRCTTPSVATR
jgi:hypothetical protein